MLRVPLFLAPAGLLSHPTPDPEFLVTWNNVVVETAGSVRRAEGFSNALSGGDEQARQIFAKAGYHLDLLPPIVESIVRNGGYRCASNHLRR